ncbi:MAG: alpha-amylase family glycosyl hydrolase [Prochlorothrix sp.]|nr:alpha-amylase family glycosyl hydrolase [Prochlorothrix sp.]
MMQSVSQRFLDQIQRRVLWPCVAVILAVLLILGPGGHWSLAQAANAWRGSRGNLGNDVLYYIVVDRFFDGDPSNNIPVDAFPITAELDPSTQAYNRANRSILPHTYDSTHRYMNLYWGGDLAGVIQKLDYLQDLGVTKIILSEIQDSANVLLYDPGSSNYLYETAKTDGEPVDDFYAHVNAGFNSGWTKDWFEIDEHFRDLPSYSTQKGIQQGIQQRGTWRSADRDTSPTATTPITAIAAEIPPTDAVQSDASPADPVPVDTIPGDTSDASPADPIPVNPSPADASDPIPVDASNASPADPISVDAGPDDRLRLFRQLLNAAHDRGIGVILALNLNHSSPYRSQLTYKPFNPNQSEQWLIDNGAIYRHGERVADYIALEGLEGPAGPERTEPGQVAQNSSDLDNLNQNQRNSAQPSPAQPSPAATGRLNPQGWFHEPIALDYNRPTAEMLEKAPIAGLPDLDQANPQVEAYLLEALQFWLTANPDGAPIAGFYLPDIPQINVSFWQKLESTIAATHPETILIAAYGDGGYRKLDSITWYEKTQSYSLVNYTLSIALRRFFGQDRGWDGRTAVLRETLLGKAGRYYNYGPVERVIHWILNPSASLEVPRHALDVVSEEDAKGWVNFVDSPEQPRLLSYYKGMTYQAYASALKFMFTSEGVPLVLYGSETGLAVPHHPRHSGPFGIGGSPFNQQMMIWPGAGGWNDRLYQMTRNLMHLRQDYPVLRYGKTQFLFPEGAQADQDLFMLRKFENCDDLEPDCPDPSQVLYAYSTEGGNFLLSFEEHQVRSILDVEAETVYPAVKGLVPIKLQPEEAKVFVLRQRR